MAETEDKKMLTEAEYRRLIREACSHPRQPNSNETLEDAYWWSICREVYRFLGLDFMFLPIEGASRGEVYRHNLRRVVGARQSEGFDSLFIPTRYIDEALSRKKLR